MQALLNESGDSEDVRQPFIQPNLETQTRMRMALPVAVKVTLALFAANIFDGENYVVHVVASPQWLASGPGHSVGGELHCRHSLWPRLGSNLHEIDAVLYSIAEKVKYIAIIYLVDITEVPDFNKVYELYDPCTVMFFFRNKHIMIDLGTGNNNTINWPMEDKQEMIDIVEIVYRGAHKGRGLVVSPKACHDMHSCT
ncbi:hypothetical protein scyTo_0012189 [Scyliorhinus torazame]|uniref:Thioredoxin-like protein n=1 Tax=Scyliorhinus torazame TaxID=75743 RepID=A0A401P3U0_SCYTO|nr:hypothetical protein [Scyliorhinus torazame]